MGSGATNFQYRKVLNRESANAIEVISNIPRTQYVPGCYQKTLLCCWNMGTCKWCKCNCNCCISGKVGEIEEHRQGGAVVSCRSWCRTNSNFVRPTLGFADWYNNYISKCE
ncbi:unnamed protein product [Ectocarpus sp. CCAP 1310/34]|nr:unnamed protein product [Ectocarpus sp. CCAP 1310/34]